MSENTPPTFEPEPLAPAADLGGSADIGQWGDAAAPTSPLVDPLAGVDATAATAPIDVALAGTISRDDVVDLGGAAAPVPTSILAEEAQFTAATQAQEAAFAQAASSQQSGLTPGPSLSAQESPQQDAAQAAQIQAAEQASAARQAASEQAALAQERSAQLAAEQAAAEHAAAIQAQEARARGQFLE